jgi:hypothetical protein
LAASAAALSSLPYTAALEPDSEHEEKIALDSSEAPSMFLIPLASIKHVQTYS